MKQVDNRIKALTWLYSAIREDGGSHFDALKVVIATALEISKIGNVAEVDASDDAEDKKKSPT